MVKRKCKSPKFDVIVCCQGQPFHYYHSTLIGALVEYGYQYLKNEKYGTMNFSLKQVLSIKYEEEYAEKRVSGMKKVFISQPMNGLSDLQIEKDRARVIEYLYNYGYEPDEIMVIDTFIKENAPDNVNSGLWYLGRSLELLADADIAVFAKGWREARGCQIEFKCAKEYGISYICED